MNGIKFANVVAFRNWWYKPNYVSFFQNIFLKHVSLKRFYLCMKLFNQVQFLKKEITVKCLAIKCFTTPKSEYVIANICMVTIEKFELVFLYIIFPCINCNSLGSSDHKWQSENLISTNPPICTRFKFHVKTFCEVL